MFWGRSVLKQATKIPFRKYNMVLDSGWYFQTSMSLKSLYSIKKEIDVSQGLIPLKCKTSLGCSVTAVLGNLTFRNVCKAPSIGDAALCWCWSKRCCQSRCPRPHFLSARAVFAGHAPVPDGAWHVFVHRSQMTTWAARELASVPLCLSLASVTSQVPLLQLFCYTPVRQSHLDVPNISPGSAPDFLQQAVTRVRSRQ